MYNKQKWIEAIDKRLEASFAALTEAIPETLNRDDLMNDIDRLLFLRERIAQYPQPYYCKPDPDLTVAETEDVPVTPEPAPAPEPEAEAKPETESVKAPAPAEEAPAAATEPTMTKDQMRAELSALANTGVDIAGVMSGFGFKKLSDVPAERYAELLAAAKAKVA